MKFTFDEWFVVELARTIRDGEVTFHGFASPCAQVAMHLAKRTHAPNMMVIEGAMYAIDPEPPFIPPTGNDAVLKQGSVYSMRFEEFFDAAVRGDIDRMFLSGIQIDPHGNANLTAVGGMPNPKVKIGGGGGGCNVSATVGHLTIWSTNHRTGRCLVSECDFITDIGHRTPAGTRADLGYTGGGPDWMVTELGIFDFPDGRARLQRIFPDVAIDELEKATGFTLDVAADLTEVDPPEPSQIEWVRRLDPLGIRRNEFRPGELQRTFAL